MQKTSIEWTDYSAALLKYRDGNSNVVHACVKVSPGCNSCYAESISKRFEGRKYTLPMTNETKPFFDEEEAKRILQSKVLGKFKEVCPKCGGAGSVNDHIGCFACTGTGVVTRGARVFIDDMTDLFGEWVPDDIINQHFRLFSARKDVVFQILTKRSERMMEYCSKRWGTFDGKSWPPLPNVWLGVSVENEKYADERIPHLLKTPAAVRFISAEPLLGPVDLTNYLNLPYANCPKCDKRVEFDLPAGMLGGLCCGERIKGGGQGSPSLNWIIVGGESGHGARPMQAEWAQSIRDQCQAAGVPFFFKQWGNFLPPGQDGATIDGHQYLNCGDEPDRIGKKKAGRLLDGRTWDEMPVVK